MKQYITESNIDFCSEYQKAKHASSGAIVMFSGDVRNLNKGKQVLHIDYEAYIPLAEKTINQILTDAKLKWDLNYAHCIHKVGKTGICDTAVVVVTSAVHRKEAYVANRYIIDRVKNEAPIWKHEFYADGTSEWGTNCDCAQPEHSH